MSCGCLSVWRGEELSETVKVNLEKSRSDDTDRQFSSYTDRCFSDSKHIWAALLNHPCCLTNSKWHTLSHCWRLLSFWSNLKLYYIKLQSSIQGINECVVCFLLRCNITVLDKIQNLRMSLFRFMRVNVNWTFGRILNWKLNWIKLYWN